MEEKQPETSEERMPQKRPFSIFPLLVFLLSIVLAVVMYRNHTRLAAPPPAEASPRTERRLHAGYVSRRNDGSPEAGVEKEVWDLARQADSTFDEPDKRNAILAEIVRKLRGRDSDFAHFNLTRALIMLAERADDPTRRAQLLDEAIAFRESPNNRVQIFVTAALMLKAELAKDTPLKLGFLDQAIARNADSDDPDLRIQVARALADKALLVPRSERPTVYDALVAELADIRSLEAEQLRAWGMMGQARYAPDDQTKARIFAQVRRRYAKHPDPYIQKQARFAEEGEIRFAGEHEERIREIIALGHDGADVPMRAAAAEAMNQKARLARNQEDKIRLYNEVIARFADSRDWELVVRVIDAYTERAKLLKTYDAYDEFITKYENHPNPIVRMKINHAKKAQRATKVDDIRFR